MPQKLEDKEKQMIKKNKQEEDEMIIQESIF